MREGRKEMGTHFGTMVCPETVARERGEPLVSGTLSWGSVVLAVLSDHLKAPQVGLE